ncbi:methionine adenosyltransferase [Candidatus Uhrbacteria bacterium RIFOXYB12_FULL_58_10]|uniref:Methionine adenosyltransferase n=1 Tax=Candidatus Uhrbacteria bacterium RIFOXYB2_FULL_57_15 TaxID=1802422 RepID=A0A1F7W8F1_9BACT|nr:MAG: methionine adenosyltransferase [Candidatus Uhrbacteria bacterium RIFOXYB12_FULL_58_10]OGL99050.1 MAG: methionine adenosyltransferase [Candidatus Uhrbacteria bacterium RIFOXYB2_FULL_57_15]OGM00271.1 MAG: methionine adenosyltransferase [Candidatus Uhrbacteria bacterium RIFOXYC12_FULL_57_11]
MYLPSIYTVESVTSGHPDKVCDQISDAILDTCLTQDPSSRVAIETFGGHGVVLVCGEVTTRAKVDYAVVARSVYRDIGYDDRLLVLTNVVAQSPDIARGVETGGAGDQGIMYGFATDETPEFMPRGVVLAHALTHRLETLRRSGEIPWLRPDGKAQVTMRDGEVATVLVSTQHAAEVGQNEIRRVVVENVIGEVLDADDVEVLVNPTGSFVRGGFEADTGLTGRKIMVDTYGGLVPHGGGAFSGKDATKVDRSAAYMARFVARHLVAEGHAKQCLVSVAYAIGRAKPVMVSAIDETGRDLSVLASAFDFRPAAIIERLELTRPIFQQTAAYGHFGRANFFWEQHGEPDVPVLKATNRRIKSYSPHESLRQTG